LVGIDNRDMNKAVFLDRDGVIMPDNGHVLTVHGVEVPEEVGVSLKRLSDAGYLLLIITNQSAIGHGWLSFDTLDTIHREMKTKLNEVGAHIDSIYTCPHSANDDCRCRKPRSGLLEMAIAQHWIDPSLSWIIGDRKTDIVAGAWVGVRGILIDSPPMLSKAVDTILGT
jgi:histidinol-phosphate phosphatase family protein